MDLYFDEKQRLPDIITLNTTKCFLIEKVGDEKGLYPANI